MATMMYSMILIGLSITSFLAVDQRSAAVMIEEGYGTKYTFNREAMQQTLKIFLVNEAQSGQLQFLLLEGLT
jgi:hypothetical protein